MSSLEHRKLNKVTSLYFSSFSLSLDFILCFVLFMGLIDKKRRIKEEIVV